jgi:hypothetical protein
LEKANYVDARKNQIEIKDPRMKEVFAFFSFGKSEYKKLIILDKTKVADQNISLNGLKQVCNISISKLT